MIRVWAELRGAVGALVLLGLIARLLMPLAAAAEIERVAFDAGLKAAMCLPSGLPASNDQDRTPSAKGGHCPLCRLPDAAEPPPPAVLTLPAAAWALTSLAPSITERQPLRPPPLGPPPARAPPAFPNIG